MNGADDFAVGARQTALLKAKTREEKRERALKLAAEGLSCRVIAERLSMSRNEVSKVVLEAARARPA